MCELKQEQNNRQQKTGQTLVIPMVEEVFKELTTKEPVCLQTHEEMQTHEEIQPQQLEKVSLSGLGIEKIIPDKTGGAQDLSRIDKTQKMNWKERLRAKRAMEETEQKEKTADSLTKSEGEFTKLEKEDKNNEPDENTSKKTVKLKKHLNSLMSFDLSKIATGTTDEFVKSYGDIRKFMDMAGKAKLMLQSEFMPLEISKALLEKSEIYIRYANQLGEYTKAKYGLLTDRDYVANSGSQIKKMKSENKEKLIRKEKNITATGYNPRLSPQEQIEKTKKEMINERHMEQEKLKKLAKFYNANDEMGAFFNNRKLGSREVPKLQKKGGLNCIDRGPTRARVLNAIYSSRTDNRFFEKKSAKEIAKARKFNIDMQEEIGTDDFDQVCGLIAESEMGFTKNKVRRELNPKAPDYLKNLTETYLIANMGTDIFQLLNEDNYLKVREIMGKENMSKFVQANALGYAVGEASKYMLEYMTSGDYLKVGQNAKNKFAYNQYMTSKMYMNSGLAGSNTKDSSSEIFSKDIKLSYPVYNFLITSGAGVDENSKEYKQRCEEYKKEISNMNDFSIFLKKDEEAE